MSDRLSKIFREIFGDLSEEELRTLSYGNYAKWDSFNHLRLISKIQNDYDLNLSFNQMKQMNSFVSISDFIKEHDSSEK
jgi:acyl carrier protein